MSRKLCFILLLFTLASFVYAAPGIMYHTEEHWIGIIGDDYVVMEVVFHNPGYYGYYTETYTLIFRNKISNVETKRQFIKKQISKIINYGKPDWEWITEIVESSEDDVILDLMRFQMISDAKFEDYDIYIENDIFHIDLKYYLSESCFSYSFDIPFEDYGNSDDQCLIHNVLYNSERYYLKIQYGSYSPINIRYYSIPHEGIPQFGY